MENIFLLVALDNIGAQKLYESKGKCSTTKVVFSIKYIVLQFN